MIDLKSLNNRLGFKRMLHEISLIPLFVFRSILRYNFSVIYFNGTIQTYDGRSPTAQLLLGRDYVHYEDPMSYEYPEKVRAASLLLRTYCTFTVFLKVQA